MPAFSWTIRPDHMHGAEIWMIVDMQTSKTLYVVQSLLLTMSKR